MKRKIAALSTVLILSLAGCSSSAAPASDNSAELESLKAQIEELTEENEALKAQIESLTQEAETESEKMDSSAVVAIGETAALKDWSISVTNAQLFDAVSDGQFMSFEPEEGNKYFLIDLSITNNGKNADSFLPSYGFGDDVYAKLIYQGEYEYSSTNLLGYSKELHDTTVNPLSTKSGSVAFEIPDSIATTEEELILLIGSGKDTVNFKVR